MDPTLKQLSKTFYEQEKDNPNRRSRSPAQDQNILKIALAEHLAMARGEYREHIETKAALFQSTKNSLSRDTLKPHEVSAKSTREGMWVKLIERVQRELEDEGIIETNWKEFWNPELHKKRHSTKARFIGTPEDLERLRNAPVKLGRKDPTIVYLFEKRVVLPGERQEQKIGSTGKDPAVRQQQLKDAFPPSGAIILRYWNFGPQAKEVEDALHDYYYNFKSRTNSVDYFRFPASEVKTLARLSEAELLAKLEFKPLSEKPENAPVP